MKQTSDWLRVTLFLSALLIVAGCGRAPATPPAAEAATAEAATPERTPADAATAPDQAASRPGTGAAPSDDASASPYAFSVDITLSAAAAKRLAHDRETIKLAAYYYGLPKPGLPEGIENEMGQVHLGGSELEIPGADGSVRFDGKGLQPDRLGDIEGEPQVNLNVFSGRHASENNLIDCGFFEDAVQVAHAAPIRLHCTLIGE